MGPLEKSEGNKGLQERCVPAAEGSRWEGGETALACYRCQPDDALERASGLHWCENRRPLQAFDIPLLGVLFFLCFVPCTGLGEVYVVTPSWRSRDAYCSLSDLVSGIRRRT